MIELQVSGTSPVSLTALVNGAVVLSGTDSSGTAITRVGSAGVRITGSGSGTDIIRTIWAGAIGGPSASISSPAPTVRKGFTTQFTAVGLLGAGPTEAITWSASPGNITTGGLFRATSGVRSTVTWTSADLPTHAASASVRIPAVGGPAPLDFPPSDPAAER